MSYRFRELREKAGLTTAELARRIGVSQAAVSQWDTGKKFPSSEMLCKLADIYMVYLLIICSVEKLPSPAFLSSRI